eukprot:scaffold9160_cov64-Cylindrotheca_fusiformis.AAC.1
MGRLLVRHHREHSGLELGWMIIWEVAKVLLASLRFYEETLDIPVSHTKREKRLNLTNSMYITPKVGASNTSNTRNGWVRATFGAFSMNNKKRNRHFLGKRENGSPYYYYALCIKEEIWWSIEEPPISHAILETDRVFYEDIFACYYY